LKRRDYRVVEGVRGAIVGAAMDGITVGEVLCKILVGGWRV